MDFKNSIDDVRSSTTKVGNRSDFLISNLCETYAQPTCRSKKIKQKNTLLY